MLVATNQVFLANISVDMRKSIDALTLLVDSHFSQEAAGGCYYVFCNRKRDKIKILYWDKNGFALWYKRLEKSTFKVNLTSNGTVTLSPEKLQWLLSGLDIEKTRGHKALNYTVFS